MNSPTSTLVEIEFHGAIMVATILTPQMRDINEVQAIKTELIKAIVERGPREIIIDLKQVEFVASVGFLVFLAARREAAVQQIALCRVRDNVHEVFSLCRLVSTSHNDNAPFIVHPTLQTALAAVAIDLK